MTLIARNRTVSAIKWERRRCVVVEGTALPSRFRMASLAIGTEPGLRMHRFCRGSIILLVTSHTSGRRTRVALRMALVACQTQMPALKRKTSGFVVVESSRFPIRFIVAHLAIRRELRGRVRWVGRGVVILLVAGHTSRQCTRKTLRMTLIARNHPVPAVEWERCRCVVVEGTALPSRFRMAGLAIGAEPGLRMHRFRRGVVILLVTSHTSRRSARKALRMALVACQTQMPALEREAGRCIVVESGRFPIRFIVAHLAILGKLCSHMRRIRCGIVILQMARNAFGTHRVEPQLRTRLVASVAIHPGMPAFQGKTVSDGESP